MPTVPRLFVAAPLFEGAEVSALPAQAHYLGSVLRRAVGDEVRLFNGEEGEWRARIAALKRDRGAFIVERRTRAQEDEPALTLAFALLKRDATDLVVQKATELGVTVVQPVITERTQGSQVNIARLAAIATEAAEQCERLRVPVLHPPRRLDDLLNGWPDHEKLAVAVERTAAGPLRAGCARALLIGPEGGFSAGELDVLERRAFVVTATLGPRILRAETAAIVGLALLQAPQTEF